MKSKNVSVWPMNKLKLYASDILYSNESNNDSSSYMIGNTNIGRKQHEKVALMTRDELVALVSQHIQ